MKLSGNIPLPSTLNDKIDEQLAILHDLYSKKELALILGAGISVPFGLPQWNELLSKCFSTCLANNLFGKSDFASLYQKEYESMKKTYPEQVGAVLEGLIETDSKKRITAPNGGSALEVGQHYYGALKSEEMMLKLFNGSDADEKAFSERIFLQIVRENLMPSKTLEEVKKGDLPAILLCTQMIQSGKIRDVITYNFDSLLEACLVLYAKMDQSSFCVHRDGCKLYKVSDKPQIYHVHGQVKTPLYRDEDEKTSHSEEECTYGENSEALVFSEDSYYEIERYTYDWRNVVQARLLLEKTCVFIGFSGDDYNFRRLVKQIPPTQRCRSSSTHYIFLLLDGVNHQISEDLKRKSGLSASNQIQMRKVLLNYHMALKTQYLHRIGIEPVWTTAEDLSKMLRKIMETS